MDLGVHDEKEGTESIEQIDGISERMGKQMSVWGRKWVCTKKNLKPAKVEKGQ